MVVPPIGTWFPDTLYYGRPIRQVAAPPERPRREVLARFAPWRSHPAVTLFAFLDLLRDFAAESRFMEFHAAHAARFRALAEEARRVLRRTRVVGPLEDYFGVREHGYHLILAPLLPAGGYAAEVERPPGIVDCYAILGPSGAGLGQPRFWDPDALEALLWHEFSHVFVGNLPRLLAGLERYERERALFPTLGDFCPALAEALHRPGAPRIEKP